MADDTQSSQIYLSRDHIREQITTYLNDYLELENVDLAKSSFLSFIINILSTLTSNLLFYETSTYKEFFLTQAQLPESVLNLSAFLGYNTQEASYANANVLVTVPFGFDDSTSSFTLAEGFRFYTSANQFMTYYTTTVTIFNNSSVTATVNYQNKVYNLPVNIDTTSNDNFSFLLPVRQYKINIQEFQIDSDIELYQFPEIDIPLSGQVSSLSVVVTPPGSSTGTEYTEYASLYLMSSTTTGYVSRRTSIGRKIYFGNGLIGKQPDPGSTVTVTIYETDGEDGNVIAGSINRGDRIYTTNSLAQTKIVDYSCINTSPASGGTDEESIEEIRNNSIANLVSMSRFVAETDYKNTNVIISDSPFGQNSLGVLKRSDVKCNEIQLFTTLNYGSDIVPTRNASYTMGIPTLPYLAKFTTIDIDGVDYYTLFDMTLDYLNGSAYYDYILNAISITPVLNITYNPDYSLIELKTLEVSDSTGSALFELTYNGSDSSAACIMEILETGQLYTMTNDTTSKKFVYSFTPYTTFPKDEVTLYFTYSSPGYGSIARYYVNVTFREDLREFMQSNLVSDSTTVTIYDIPVIEADYYNDLDDKENFELECLQKMLAVSDFENYRMLTDFINLKFANTTGSMINMTYNKVNRLSVIDIVNTPPSSPSLDDRYIVGPEPTGTFAGHAGQYVQCIDSTSETWYFTKALSDDIVYVTNLAHKYIYTGTEWIIPIYSIPLQIEIEAFKSQSYFGSDSELINTIKSTLVSTFSDRFGINIEIYRSEIIKVVQETTGVDHCNLKSPKSDIFLNFALEDLSQEELMTYSPEYVSFSEDDISIIII